MGLSIVDPCHAYFRLTAVLSHEVDTVDRSSAGRRSLCRLVPLLLTEAFASRTFTSVSYLRPHLFVSPSPDHTQNPSEQSVTFSQSL